MAEYIEKDAAIAALTEFCYEQTVSKYLSVDDCLVARGAIERAIKVLESLPAADVEPVKRGSWIKESDGGTRCSVCNKRVRDVTGGWDEPVDLSDMPYCPKCGARMDEEVNT